jgi:hypothetical protein
MLTRIKLLEQLAQLIILVPNASHTIGIILPSFSEVKRFNYDLSCLIHSVPNWLDTGQITKKSIRQIEHGQYGTIIFLNDVNHARGRSFKKMYISSNCTEDQKTQFMFSILPTMVNGKVETFSDLVTDENSVTK